MQRHRDKKLRAFGLVSALCFPLAMGPLAAGSADAQSLHDALAAAYATSPALGAGRAELRAVNENVPQELANWRPRVEATATAGRTYRREKYTAFVQKEDPVQNTQETVERVRQRWIKGTPVQADISIVQTLYRGGRTVAGTNRAENEILSQRAVLTATEQGVLLQAATAYMDLWRDEAVLALTMNNQEVLQQQLSAERDRFAVGEVTRTDVAQAESRLAAAQAERLAAEGNLRASIAAFREVVGFDPDRIEDPRGTVLLLPQTRDEAVTTAKNNNPNIIAIEHAERAAVHRVRQTEGEHYPEVTLRGSLRYDENLEVRHSVTKSAEVFAQVRVPLYQAGFVSSRVRQAKEISSQLILELERTRRGVEREAIAAWERLNSARAQIEFYEVQVESAGVALEGIRQEYLVGARTTLDVLDQEQEYLNAQVNLLRAQRDEIVSGFELLAFVGHLTAQNLNLDVALYNPDIDYNAVRNRW